MIRRPRVRPGLFRRSPIASLPAIAALSAAPALSGDAVAAPPGSAPLLSNEGRADQLFHSGEKKFDSGDYPGACADFSESLKLGPKLGTLLNLALCHETIGKLVTAWSEFTHGAAWAAQNNQRDRLEFATTHIRALEPRLPRIVLQLPTHRALESLEIDGEPVPEPRWYLPLYLDPGEHHLAAKAPGKKRTTVSFRVTTAPGDQLVMIPSLPDEEALQRKAQPPVDGTRRTIGLGGLGLGVLGFAVGTTFGALAVAADTKDAAQTHATVATVAFVGGAVFAATGGWLLWTSRAGSARASLSPHVGGSGLRVEGSF